MADFTYGVLVSSSVSSVDLNLSGLKWLIFMSSSIDLLFVSYDFSVDSLIVFFASVVVLRCKESSRY